MNEQFVMIPMSLFKTKLNANAIALYGIIRSNAQRNGYAFGSNTYYAEQLGLSYRSISRLLRILLDNQLITISDSKSHRRKIYISQNYPST